MADRLLDKLTAEQYRGWPSPTPASPPRQAVTSTEQVENACRAVLRAMREVGPSPDWALLGQGLAGLSTPEERGRR